jgi:hypothetical protein
MASVMGEPYFKPVPLPVDLTDATCFPNIAKAAAHYAALSAERRAQIEAEWEA